MLLLLLAMSSRGVSDATLELSLLLNGRSFVGREVARRVVSAAAERGGCSCAVSILLRHSCCVRFFSWMESTYVPSYLAPAHSSVRSSRLEESATMLTMIALSFAKTCHTFQGQSAGPVNQGQQPNAVDRVVIDPGDKKIEGNNPGLLYMAVSRATTLGEKSSVLPATRRLDSAMCFTGHNMTRHRVLNLTLKKTGEEYKKVKLRKKWVA